MSGQGNLFHILKERVEKNLLEGNYPEASRGAEAALDSARRTVDEAPDNIEPLVEALEMLGDLDRHQGNFTSAEEHYLEALKTADGSEMSADLVARLQSSLASLYDFNGQEEQAIPLYEEAIQLFESIDPPELAESANLRNNLGMLYKGKGDHDKAEEHYLAALKMFESINGENETTAAVYNNLGALYSQSGLLEQAREMHIAALDLRKLIHTENHSDISQSHSNLAIAYYQLGENDSAEEHFSEALESLEEFIDQEPGEYAIITENYTRLLRSKGDEKKAIAAEKHAKKVLKKHGYDLELEISPA